MLDATLIVLATAGGTALVDLATSDAWLKTGADVVRLLSRGQQQPVELVERRMESTRRQLQELSGEALKVARQHQVQAWTTRLGDLLQEDSGAAHELWLLLNKLAGQGFLDVSSYDDDSSVFESNVVAVDTPDSQSAPRQGQSNNRISHKRPAYKLLGDLAAAQGWFDDAETAYGKSLVIAGQLAIAEPSNTELQRELSFSYNRLGYIATYRGDIAQAEEAYRESLAIARRLAATDPSNTEL